MQRFMRFMPWAVVIIFAVAYFWGGLRYGLTGLKLIGVSVLDAKTIVEALQSFVETMAIIVAGVWAYERFIKGRADHPYPKIQHRIEHFELGKGIVYLSVFVTLTNEGKTKLDLRDGKVHIRQVSPMPGRIKDLFEKSVKDGKSIEVRNGKIPGLFIDSGQRIGWDTLGARDWGRTTKRKPIIEPGQTKEFQFDFLIEENINVIAIISYINEDAGWGLATLYSLKDSNVDQAG